MVLENIISIIIALLALLFSVITYFIHDRKLKEQEKILNEYQLRVLAQVEEENKKAIIRARTVKTIGGKRTLLIYNIGKAKARNLIVAMDNGEQVIAARPGFPVTYPELFPNTSREITLFLLTEGDDDVILNYTWDDDSGKNNMESQTIDL